MDWYGLGLVHKKFTQRRGNALLIISSTYDFYRQNNAKIKVTPRPDLFISTDLNNINNLQTPLPPNPFKNDKITWGCNFFIDNMIQ